MRKLTRAIAAGMVSIFVVGVFAAPAGAVEAEGSLEDIMCDAVAIQVPLVAELVEDNEATLNDLTADVTAAGTALQASSEDLATTGLAWVRAVDGEADDDPALDAFVDAAGDFSTDVADWIEVVDDVAEASESFGLNSAVLTYLEGICPA